MTITVKPDPALVQSSALEEMNRLSKAATPAAPTHYHAVFVTESSQRDGRPYGTIYGVEAYSTLDQALNIAADIYGEEGTNDTRLLNVTKVCVESGSGAVIYNRAQLIAVIEARQEQAEREALASVNPHDEMMRRQSPHYDDAEW